MLIENRRAIMKFTDKHADSRTVFAEWLEKAEAAQWTDVVELKNTFNTADYVNGLIVFNVGGNNYRLLAEVIFKDKIIRIAKVGTHTEYSGWKL
ncbi:type II toxin-antitoxin system HigB family toxin [soil metagenome]